MEGRLSLVRAVTTKPKRHSRQLYVAKDPHISWLTCVLFLSSTVWCRVSTITAKTWSKASLWPLLAARASSCCSTTRSDMADTSNSSSSSFSSSSAAVQSVSSCKRWKWWNVDWSYLLHQVERTNSRNTAHWIQTLQLQSDHRVEQTSLPQSEQKYTQYII